MAKTKTKAELEKQLEYWIKRCEAAEDFIEKSPSDPDITSEQVNAWIVWLDIKRGGAPVKTNI